MTDNEIIKALECCTYGQCSDCPYYQVGCECFERDALSLINRQKAELDDLKRDDLPRCKDALRRANEIGIDLEKENKELKAEVEKLELLNAILLESCAGYSKACDTYKAEIERLQSMNQAKLDTIHDIQADNERLEKAVDNYEACLESVEKIKAEAIKEFDERLKEDCLSYPLEKGDLTMLVDVDNYNNLVKEMVGDNNE